jgi:hypothetical protein
LYPPALLAKPAWAVAQPTTEVPSARRAVADELEELRFHVAALQKGLQVTRDQAKSLKAEVAGGLIVFPAWGAPLSHLHLPSVASAVVHAYPSSIVPARSLPHAEGVALRCDLAALLNPFESHKIMKPQEFAPKGRKELRRTSETN